MGISTSKQNLVNAVEKLFGVGLHFSSSQVVLCRSLLVFVTGLYAISASALSIPYFLMVGFVTQGEWLFALMSAAILIVSSVFFLSTPFVERGEGSMLKLIVLIAMVPVALFGVSASLQLIKLLQNGGGHIDPLLKVLLLPSPLLLVSILIQGVSLALSRSRELRPSFESIDPNV